MAVRMKRIQGLVWRYGQNSFRDGAIKTTGTDFDKILSPISRFPGGSNRTLKSSHLANVVRYLTGCYRICAMIVGYGLRVAHNHNGSISVCDVNTMC